MLSEEALPLLICCCSRTSTTVRWQLPFGKTGIFKTGVHDIYFYFGWKSFKNIIGSFIFFRFCKRSWYFVASKNISFIAMNNFKNDLIWSRFESVKFVKRWISLLLCRTVDKFSHVLCTTTVCENDQKWIFKPKITKPRDNSSELIPT